MMVYRTTTSGDILDFRLKSMIGAMVILGKTEIMCTPLVYLRRPN